MPIHTRKIAALLGASGMCALIYQVAWMRQFRLIFGASTPASAAVLAIFIGGLGLGSWRIGRRADRFVRPLRVYAWLEAAIAVLAALSPLLLLLVRWLYLAIGGSVTLGPIFTAPTRLLLATVVLLPPCFLMGATLPAAVRAALGEGDRSRRAVGLIYGLNTLGAVVGCLLANFLLLEALGTQRTLWAASLVNLLVALLARRVARRVDAQAPPSADEVEPPASEEATSAPQTFVLGAAAMVGFAFFLLELVWYRMLGPILGGTVFTFGLILAVALAGIGAGAAVYSAFGQRRSATALGFALSCLLEALFVVLPYALGDRLAILAGTLRPLGAVGFTGHLFSWALVTAIVVFPAAFISGIQFPMLIALLGRGRRQIGRQVGLAYAFNTAGSIAGALAGGFGLLSWLGAPGCWRLATYLLLVTGVAALGLALSVRIWSPTRLTAAAVALSAFLCAGAQGPTAAWRHSGIGAGRQSALREAGTPNQVRAWIQDQRRTILWEQEGRESSVAVSVLNDLAFFINGKSDGSAKGDAPTVVSLATVGALLHPQPKSAMVVGLGTGTTAGWLAAVPSIEKVDVVELEPAVKRVAKACAAVNKNLLQSAKLSLLIGDAREVLQTIRGRYDLIVSEPSNPFRAGIASLFTREFYTSAATRLRKHGIFVQWLQGYEVDSSTVETVLTTLQAVFPQVEVWRAQASDMLLVASKQPLDWNVARLRARLQTEPFTQAFAATWGAIDLEGVLAHYLAGPGLAREIADKSNAALNTDDRNVVEFGFALTVGRRTGFSVEGLLGAAMRLGLARPPVRGGEIDWPRVERWRIAESKASEIISLMRVRPLTAAGQHYVNARRAYDERKLTAALGHWRQWNQPPKIPTEIALVAEGLADIGHDDARPWIERLRTYRPIDAIFVDARLAYRKNQAALSAKHLTRAFSRLRKDPWLDRALLYDALSLVTRVAGEGPASRTGLMRSLSKPFAVYIANEIRLSTLRDLLMRANPDKACDHWIAGFEPHVPWQEKSLRYRAACYHVASSPRANLAARELAQYQAAEPAAFGQRLRRH